MPVEKSDLQDLKNYISKEFSKSNRRIDKLEEGLRGNEYSPGALHHIENAKERVEKLEDRIDLEDDDIQVLKSIARGAKNWKIMLTMFATLIGGLAGIVLWGAQMIKNLSVLFK